MKRSLLMNVSLLTVLVLFADVVFAGQAFAGQGGQRGRRGRQDPQSTSRQRAVTAESGRQRQARSGYGYGRQQSQAQRGQGQSQRGQTQRGQTQQRQGQQGQGQRGQGQREGSNATGGSLSATELKGLTGMREEEKLARDVYRSLAKTSKLPVFRNIASAESRHMQALARVSTRYNANDAVAKRAPGQFTDPEVQDLYDSLVAAGSQSTLDAMMVGAKIEEMDIADLRRAMAGTTRADILAVYENLERGSRNHLRAFSSQIAALGGTYQAEYLTQAEFDEIADSPFERGRGGSQRGANGKRGRQGSQQGAAERRGGRGKSGNGVRAGSGAGGGGGAGGERGRR